MGKPINEQDNRNTNGFDVHPENINRDGAPKKIYTILKDMGFCSSDIMTAFGEIAWYTKSEAQTIADDVTKPMIIIAVANQFLKAIEKKDITKITEIISYLIPRPKQDIGIETTQPLLVFKPGQEEDVEKVKDL